MERPAGSAKLLRAINTSATLSHLLRVGRLTRADLREFTGLSKPTSSDLLRWLTDAGLAVVAGHTAGGPGPAAEIYAPNGDAGYVVALSVRDTTGEERPDLGVALCDLTGALRHRAEDAVDFARITPAEAVATAVAGAARAAGVDAARVRQVQIGVAGAYDARTDRIHHIDVPGWTVPGVAATVRARLGGGVDVAIDNDVNLAATAERARGVAADAESFAMLWLEHGLGLATYLGGTLLRGARGGAGEIGYVPLFGGGAPALTDLQDLVGGPAVLALAREHALPARTPAEAAQALCGDPDGLAALAARIGFVLAMAIAVLDPPLIVLAGGVARAGGERLRDAVVVAVQSSALPAWGGVEIAISAISDDAVLLGGLDAGLRALRESLINSVASAYGSDTRANANSVEPHAMLTP